MTLERTSVTGYERLDSRGKPTVMARVVIEDYGRIITATALVPSGASTGKKEAIELRDGGDRYLGFGVTSAVQNITEIAGAISGMHVLDQEGIDNKMRQLDGTENKGRLGANAILAVSLAVARAGAEYQRIPLFQYLANMYKEPNPALLPTPMMNVMNGGRHAKNGLQIQEFMIVPVGAKNLPHAIQMGAEVYGNLGEIITSSGVGDEGGYSPVFSSGSGLLRTHEACQMLVDAIEKSGYRPGKDIAIAIDAAASEFYRNGTYHLDTETALSSPDMIKLYQDLIRKFPLISIEDGMSEDDIEGWKRLSQHDFGAAVQIVGDDLFVTNPKIFQSGIENGLANAILVKPNQIGTLTETLMVIKMAKANGYNTIVSHRSGETEDTFIADLAVATRAGQIKIGAPARGERTAKYNRLLDIEEIELPKLGLTPEFAGVNPFSSLN